MKNPGWLGRQLRKASQTVQSLPEWMRRRPSERAMATKTILICDQCGALCEFESLYVNVRCYNDQREPEDRTESVDLCASCMRGTLDDMLKGMTTEECDAWLIKAKTSRKPVRL